MIQSQNTHSDISQRPGMDVDGERSRTTTPARKYLHFEEAMVYLGIKARSTLWRYRKQYPQLLPMAKFQGNQGWFRVSDLDAFIEHLFTLSNRPGMDDCGERSRTINP